MTHAGGDFWPSSSFYGGVSLYFFLKNLNVLYGNTKDIILGKISPDYIVFLFCFNLQADSLEEAINIINKNKYSLNMPLLSLPFVKLIYICF